MLDKLPQSIEDPQPGGNGMPFWQRLSITLVTMVVTSVLANFLWHRLFNSGIPSYLSGVVGGLTAIPVWDFLRRFRIR